MFTARRAVGGVVSLNTLNRRPNKQHTQLKKQHKSILSVIHTCHHNHCHLRHGLRALWMLCTSVSCRGPTFHLVFQLVYCGGNSWHVPHRHRTTTHYFWGGLIRPSHLWDGSLMLSGFKQLLSASVNDQGTICGKFIGLAQLLVVLTKQN